MCVDEWMLWLVVVANCILAAGMLWYGCSLRRQRRRWAREALAQFSERAGERVTTEA